MDASSSWRSVWAAARRFSPRSHSGWPRAGASAVGAWGEREGGILSVAEDLFLRNGYENTSMAAVAAAAGLSEGTLYN